MDRIMTEEERERIRRQLEAYCTAEPDDGTEQTEEVQWGYQALRPAVVNYEQRDVVEATQPPEWPQSPQSYSAHPAPENATQRDFAVFSAPANEDWQQHEATQGNHSSHTDPISEPVANGGGPVPVSTVAPDTGTQPVMHDRPGSRWFGISGALGDASAPQEAPIAPEASHVPVLAVFSLDGGVGKTSLAATLGRILSSRGERLMMMETTSYGLLPFFYGARDRRPGTVRTFRPPAASTDAPLQMISAEPDVLLSSAPDQAQFSAEIAKYTRGVNRVIIDVSTAAVAAARQLVHMSPVILVPMVPDMKSFLGVGSIESILRPSDEGSSRRAEIYYVLNQFEPSLALHLDVREALRQRLGDHLLPFELRHAPAVSEGLAEGMTVLDYAPDSAVTGDFNLLADWVKAVAAPANVSTNGSRWSESS